MDAVFNTQFVVQIGDFTAVPMIMGFILELELLQVGCFQLHHHAVAFMYYYSMRTSVWRRFWGSATTTKL
ncbi:unnamed protein product [Linum tenue]|uniref:Uncharacterized protein n=1 Tax=Linum tenue TaxID=586396 RepID=A0AAV0KVM4_9ROSI|nr:unnamed protein product [Linum tenue]